jgi:hypothetical protein
MYMRAFVGAAAALFAFGVAVVAAPSPAAAQETAVVTGDAERVERNGEEIIRLDVSVENVSDLGAFEFIVAFDNELLSIAEDEPFVEGPFLASSGRQTLCNVPVVDAGAARFECVTLGPEPREGATGSGLIASVFFDQRADGNATVQFTRAGLSTPPGESIPAEWVSGEIAVDADEGMNWLLWLGVGAAVVLVAVALGSYLVRRLGTGGERAYRVRTNEDPPSTV